MHSNLIELYCTKLLVYMLEPQHSNTNDILYSNNLYTTRLSCVVQIKQESISSIRKWSVLYHMKQVI